MNKWNKYIKVLISCSLDYEKEDYWLLCGYNNKTQVVFSFECHFCKVVVLVIGVLTV